MAQAIAFLAKYWYFFAIGILLGLTIYLGHQLRESYKDNGVLTEQLSNQVKATKSWKEQLDAANDKLTAQANEATDGFEVCQEAAAKSDSSSFKKGVEVGKILGKGEQCNTNASDSSAASWPRVASPQPAKPSVPPK